MENICSFPYNLPGRMPIRFSSALQTHSSGMERDFIKLCWNFLPGLHKTNCRCEVLFFSLPYTADCHPNSNVSCLIKGDFRKSTFFLSSTSPFTNNKKKNLCSGTACICSSLSLNFWSEKSRICKNEHLLASLPHLYHLVVVWKTWTSPVDLLNHLKFALFSIQNVNT